MKGLNRVRLGLAGVAAAALVAVGALLVVSQAAAVSGTLGISSPAIAPGGTGTADLRANVPAPGLGAWTVDITYDASKVSVGTCTPNASGVCNAHYGANVVRITGASATGLTGDTSLGTIQFTQTAATAAACSSSTLTLAASVFADATIGAPAAITVTPGGGSITCAAAAAPTTAPSLSATGYGPASNSGFGYDWLIVGLAGAGLAALAGYGALRLRGKAA